MEYVEMKLDDYIIDFLVSLTDYDDFSEENILYGLSILHELLQ